MKSIRTVGSLRWVLLAAVGLGLAACGGSNDASRPTGPVKKVAWGDSEGQASAEAEPAAEEEKEQSEKKAEKTAAAEPEDEEAAVGGNVIDLDAPKAAPSAAPRAKPEPRPEPRPEPEPVAAAEEEAEEEPEEEPPAKAEPESPSNDPLAAELRKRRAQARARSEANKEKEKAPRKKKAKPASGEEATVASYKGSDPCRAAKFSVARVREACASGGRPAAKKVMKDAIGNATATGQLLKCSDCHSNQRDYALKGDAVADLQRWLDSSSS